jgi:hypothetical protein
MAEPVQELNFSHKEVVEALIKQQGLHEGLWMLSIRFGIGAINVHPPEGEKGEIAPAAIVPIVGIGLRKVNTLNPLALDAAQINPTPKLSRFKRSQRASEHLTSIREKK